jgi:Arc/MetJ-type ribon-helix-helix transcriptional regulator
MDVTLRPELPKLIDDEVKSGRSADASDFLNKALYHFVLARDLGQDFTQVTARSTIARQQSL